MEANVYTRCLVSVLGLPFENLIDYKVVLEDFGSTHMKHQTVAKQIEAFEESSDVTQKHQGCIVSFLVNDLVTTHPNIKAKVE